MNLFHNFRFILTLSAFFVKTLTMSVIPCYILVFSLVYFSIEKSSVNFQSFMDRS